MRKSINIVIVFVFIVFLTGFQKMEGVVDSGREGAGQVAGHDGIVVDVINVEGYTYVELHSNNEKTWIAAPSFAVEKGDRVLASRGLEMRNYYSKFLEREFPLVWFVGTIEVVSKEEVGLSSADSPLPVEGSEKSPVSGSIAKVKGGYSLEEIFNKKTELADSQVSVRAKVVKSSGVIMGKRWYHIQDGTGEKAALDLVVTSQDEVQAGRVVLVTGKLGVDKDFGSGYRYDVILEDAAIKVE